MHLRVFIASPGDVKEEREIVSQTLARLNYDPLIRGKVWIEVVAWDGPFLSVPLVAGVEPQEAIKQGLPRPSECDLVVVILKSRLGTNLPLNYAAEFGRESVTGTEWEYLDALRTGSMARSVLVYRSIAPLSFTDDPSAVQEYQRVEAFFARMRSEGSGYNSYAHKDGIGGVFEGHFKSLLVQHWPEIVDPEAELVTWDDLNDSAIVISNLLRERWSERHPDLVVAISLRAAYLAEQVSRCFDDPPTTIVGLNKTARLDGNAVIPVVDGVELSESWIVVKTGHSSVALPRSIISLPMRRVLVLDDWARTGTTLDAARRILLSLPNVNQVVTAAPRHTKLSINLKSPPDLRVKECRNMDQLFFPWGRAM